MNASPSSAVSYATSRTASFQAGQTGTNDIASSLNTASSVFNTKVTQVRGTNAPSLTPNSVLMAYMRSPNGMSVQDAKRQTPSGQLPSMNANSAQTYNLQNPQFGYKLGI